MPKKNICIHGHFYQPPRENPWLGKVEIQESAYPYHDWNHRINAECYDRNAFSRILNNEGSIQDITSNYALMSYNIGPTLLAWMESEAPETYRAIIEADKVGQQNFGGHGPALAQAYNHMIMPLANHRDKHTQIIWGIKDFEYRYGRKPEGMWLGETAVNTETLEALAEHKILFTILSPYQAKAYRSIGDEEWQDGTGANIDPRRPYLCKLPSGNNISLFFYDGPASQAVAFEGLLDNGEKFANRLREVLEERDEPQLAHIATDGESYGHHHRKGEMALSYCLHTIRTSEDLKLTIYGQYLENHPPEWEVQILENTSWSCAHGVERWRSNCGCNTGGHADWNQEWRGPLREAFDWVRDQLETFFEKKIKEYTDDPWEVRNDYIRVILDRSEENVSDFLEQHFSENLLKEEEVKLLKLLEMQYHAMLMYTSCGWFFDEVTGLESMQDILYATRALQLAKEVGDEDFTPGFEELLAKIPSNMSEFENALQAYEKYVKPMVVDLLRVGAHYAVASLFNDDTSKISLYSFLAEPVMQEYRNAGKQKLVIGRTLLKSEITWEEIDISYAVLHLGEHHLFGGVRAFVDEETLNELQKEMEEAFEKNRIYEIFNLMDKHFGAHSYSFWHLFKDDQKNIMEHVMNDNLKNAEGVLDQLYQTSYPLIQVYKELNLPVPRSLKLPIDLALTTRVGELLQMENTPLEELQETLTIADKGDVELDLLTLNFLADKKTSRLMERFAEVPRDGDLLKEIVQWLKIINKSALSPEYRTSQNIAFQLRQQYYDEMCGESSNSEWCGDFDELYLNLNLKK